MKYFLFLVLVFVPLFTISQEKFSREISFITENDLYTSIVRDRYYSSGIFLVYRYLSNKKNKSQEKRILEWKLGQEMYTPHKSVVNGINEHDRPFAGYLYGSFGINRVYKKDQILNTSIQIGVIGTNSYAQELQEFIHDIYHFKKAVGWQYQIENAFTLNFNAEYLKTILKAQKNSFDVTWTNNINFGTIYTNISTGFNARIAIKPLQNLSNSIGFNTNLNNEQNNSFKEIESFLYINPKLRYAFYDATLQGSFLNTASLVTKELIPVVFDIELGIKFTSNRFNFGYAFIYNTSKSKDLRHTYGHKYGNITISYLLR